VAVPPGDSSVRPRAWLLDQHGRDDRLPLPPRDVPRQRFEGVCSKSKLPTTTTTATATATATAAAAAAAAAATAAARRRNHNPFFQLLLRVFIVARVIFKRLNPGATEDGAEDVFVVRRHLPAADPTQRLPLGHVRDGLVKDSAQDVAEGVLGAGEDGSSSFSGGKVIIAPVTCPELEGGGRVGCSSSSASGGTHATPALGSREGRTREGRGAGRCGGRATGRGAGRGAGPGLRSPGGAHPPRHATAAVFVQLALRWGRNWAAQWHLARAVEKRFRGCRAKRLYVHYFEFRLSDIKRV